ncbi:MAG: MerR family transcriptional regulator [Myxococcales bacterium]|jgi:DNA-binding transcriptional MerR regulator|nr:MerR family transcriptional regulator [Deltaproteobacteria bacterium]NOQ82463.1 MerR family transcriptional regulator [Myxococcales bacterium]MBW2191463.1 MerR family transcriptional regulator [Deltaproteobacteria bacterium]MBW2546716.1 MerR family transcriptional regulator [Deltaproteobacteria bacterium]MBW2718850.1 MerR family transcriptional regulator [Deltaproteobacteria bacterium]
MTRRTQLPDKLFFKIGEVADIVGVKPHALRYWETEFPALRPKKTRGAHRQYSRRDVELAMLIRQLLHDEGYTIPGARKRIRHLGRHQVSSPPEPRAQREVALRAELLGLRQQLTELLDDLSKAARPPADAAPLQVTVHKVVPVTVNRSPEP